MNYEEVLSQTTMSNVIHWIHNYNGENYFINSCKRIMLSNHPLTHNQIVGLKKCYAYFKVNKSAQKASTDLQIKKINEDIEGILSNN